MIYKAFGDLQLSALGMGAMRLPVVDGDDSKIDEAAAFAMVDECPLPAKIDRKKVKKTE